MEIFKINFLSAVGLVPIESNICATASVYMRNSFNRKQPEEMLVF